MLVKDLPKEERPREKLARFGAAALSDAELLAILLRTGTKQESVLRVAERLLAEHKERGLRALSKIEPKELAKVKGIGMVKAVTVTAALELGKRLAERSAAQKKVINSPKDAADYVMARFRDETREHFLAMLLDKKNQVLAVRVISIGGLTSSVVHPREVFREAVLASAAAVILLHNHPSGNPNPSEEDVSLTERLAEAGRIMGIDVIDHIVIGDNEYISLKETGLVQL